VPQVKVCLWNMQKYGGAVAQTASAVKYGVANERRNAFIAQFVQQQQIDLLMLMEVENTADASIRDLLLKIGQATNQQDWMVAACGSALEPGANIPPNANQVTYQTDRRSEGYAVFYRRAHPHYRMVKGLRGIANRWYHIVPGGPGGHAPLNLVTSGRPVQVEDVKRVRDGSTRAMLSAKAGYLPPNEYPFQDPNTLGNSWPNLSFPTTSVRNYRDLDMPNARRPAYVVLQLQNGRGEASELLPVAVYHAPSNLSQASWGAFMAGLSRELYATSQVDPTLSPRLNWFVHCKNTVLGGDFNYGERNLHNGWYGYFTAAFGAGGLTGANCTGAPPRAQPEANWKTTVQLLAGGRKNKRPIPEGEIDDYFTYDIDLVFRRSERNSSAERVNVLEVLQNDVAGAVYGQVLQAVGQGLEQFEQILGPGQLVDANRGPGEEPRGVWKPLISGAWGGTFTDYTEFKNEVNGGYLARPRALAEYFHLFVSDHLPLTVTVEI
jgi:hypothetical protein